MSPTAVNISDNPKIRNCGVIQKIDIVSFKFTAESLLLFSVMAAETIEKVERKRPKPIRFKGEIPEVWPVNFLANGTKKVSYKGTMKMSIM